jgi:hypothetical protein
MAVGSIGSAIALGLSGAVEGEEGQYEQET